MNSPSPTHRNVREIGALEREALAGRSLSDRIGDVIARRAGTMWFVVFQFCWFALWIGMNVRGQGPLAFDPFPFSLLTMIVSIESIFLSIFILMSQNRSRLQADQRNHLELQINLLSEHENTKMIMMLQALCEQQGLAIAKDPEISALAQRTKLKEVLSEIKDHLPSVS